MVKEINVKEEKINLKEYFGQGWLDVVSIIEIAGMPASHIQEVMTKLIEGFEKEKDVKVIYKKIHEPKEVENKEAKGIFSTFAELEFIAKSFNRVMEYVIDYMPSSVEIVAPTDMSIKLNEANSVLNDLIARIHKYEAFMKTLASNNIILQKELNRLQQIIQRGRPQSQPLMVEKKEESKTEEKKEKHREKDKPKKEKKKKETNSNNQ